MKINFKLVSILFLLSMMPLYSSAETSGVKVGETELQFFGATGENAKGKTVLILPGGGYEYHAMDHEGFDWVPFFNSQGVNVAVLKYKLPKGNSEIPINDVRESVESLKKIAKELNVNPYDIGIMGFSAGGHLASTYATHSNGENKPAFQILFYPVISMTTEKTHKGSRDNLLGSDQSDERIKLFSNEFQVNENTPPAIIFHSADDGGVVPSNSIDYYTSLNEAGIPVSLHIYPVGGHGWGFRENFPYHDAILNELSVWLANLDSDQGI